MLVVLWFCLPARSVVRLDICAAMSLRKGFQLLAPRLGDQGARYLAAPLCSSAASLPLPSSDDRSPVCSSCIPAFSRGRQLDVLILVTIGQMQTANEQLQVQASLAILPWHQPRLDCLPLSTS